MKTRINGVLRKTTLTVDTLQLNLKGITENYSEIYNLIETQKERYFIDKDISLDINSSIKRGNYRYTLDVYFKNDRFAYFQFVPTNSYQNQELIPFVIENSRLYQVGWTAILLNVMASLKLEIHSISNLHLSLDGNGINENFIKMFYCKDLKLTARPDPRGVVCNTTKRIKPDKGIKLGSTKSNWNISFYRKSKEYIKKPYIKNFHFLNGIDVYDSVDRCELRLSNAEALKYMIDISRLEEIDTLIGIFKKYSDEKLSFKHLAKYHYDNNNRIYDKVQLFVFPDSDYELKRSERNIKMVGKIKSKKTAITQILFDHIAEPSARKIKILKDFTKKYDLGKWLNNKYANWDLKENTERLRRAIREITDDRTAYQILIDTWRAISWTSVAWLAIVLI